MKNVTLIVDMQFGSTGKGLIAGYLAERDAPDTVINANMPNAGHTYINDEGRVWMHKVLPNGIVSPELKRVMIGPGSVFDVGVFQKEVVDSHDLLQDCVIIIHQDAVVLHSDHALFEKQNFSGVSSTMQGSAAAMMSKMMRDSTNDHRATSSESLAVAREILFDKYGVRVMVVDQGDWLAALHSSSRIQAEGAQGYSLGMNAGFWPYCTSRDCTPARFLADMGIPVQMLKTVVGTARVHPIRVGNTPDGYSGDSYSDQLELSWSELGQTPELTTVTKRVRRVFTWSWEQFNEAYLACMPDEVFLNFCNYDEEQAAELVRKINNSVEMDLVRYTGHGPKRCDINETISGEWQ